MRTWVSERLHNLLNTWTERAIAAAVIFLAVLLWRNRDRDFALDLSLPLWVAALWALATLLILTSIVVLLYRRTRTTEELQGLVELGEWYAVHLHDALEILQKIVSGTIPNVTPGTFIEAGVLQPAREFLMQRPGEDVRLSVLVPVNGEWRMPFAAGYRLESKQRFSLSMDASFSRHAYESGEIQFSGDLVSDPRFIPHPQASRTYHSIISMPVRSGDSVVAVLNVDSTYRDAFPGPDFIYVRLLGAILGVVWSLTDIFRDAPRELDEGDGSEVD